MAVTLPYPTLSTTSDKAEIESNFSTLGSKFGQIDNADVKSGAGIDVDKLSAQYEYCTVTLRVLGALSGTGYKDFVPVPYDTKGAWTVAAGSYTLRDAGSAACSFSVVFGYPTDASTTFNVSTTVVATTTPTASDGNYRHGSLTISGSTITPSTNYETLALNISAAGTSVEDLAVSLMLKRKIAT